MNITNHTEGERCTNQSRATGTTGKPLNAMSFSKTEIFGLEAWLKW
jgi:hypothetical protein